MTLDNDLTPRQSRLLLAGGIALAVVLQTLCAFLVVTVTYDEGNTYLAATGHEGAFPIDRMAGRWTPVKEWRRYWSLEELWPFAAIADGLARTDVHPPLFYWILHSWIVLVGVHLAAGKLPNIVLAALAGIVVYRTCRRLECARAASAGAAVLWLLSNPTMAAAAETRSYCLLALIVALFLASLLRFLRVPSKSAAFCVFLTIFAAFLTHYQSALPVGLALAAAAVLLLSWRKYRALAGMIAASVLAAAAFAAAHPGFLGSVALDRGYLDVFALQNVPDRIRRCVASFLNLFVPLEAAWYVVAHRMLLLAVALATALAVWLYLRLTGGRDLLRALKRESSLPFVVSAATLVATFALHALDLTEKHAMGGKYLMLVTPIVFAVFGQIANRLMRARLATWRLIVVLAVCQGLIAAATTYRTVQTSKREAQGLLDVAAPIILDSKMRGVILQVLWYAPDETPAYVARQDALLERFPAVGPDESKLLYVCDLRYGNTTAKRDAILRRFSDLGFEATLISRGEFKMREVYELTRTTR